MSTIITGVVTNGVIVPSTPLPEGTQVEIQVKASLPIQAASPLSPSELRKLPRAERQNVLASAAALAEEDYLNDKELTGFDAFSEEEFDESDSRAG